MESLTHARFSSISVTEDTLSIRYTYSSPLIWIARPTKESVKAPFATVTVVLFCVAVTYWSVPSKSLSEVTSPTSTSSASTRRRGQSSRFCQALRTRFISRKTFRASVVSSAPSIVSVCS